MRPTVDVGDLLLRDFDLERLQVLKKHEELGMKATSGVHPVVVPLEVVVCLMKQPMHRHPLWPVLLDPLSINVVEELLQILSEVSVFLGVEGQVEDVLK